MKLKQGDVIANVLKSLKFGILSTPLSKRSACSKESAFHPGTSKLTRSYSMPKVIWKWLTLSATLKISWIPNTKGKTVVSKGFSVTFSLFSSRGTQGDEVAHRQKDKPQYRRNIRNRNNCPGVVHFHRWQLFLRYAEDDSKWLLAQEGWSNTGRELLKTVVQFDEDDAEQPIRQAPTQPNILSFPALREQNFIPQAIQFSIVWSNKCFQSVKRIVDVTLRYLDDYICKDFKPNISSHNLMRRLQY